MPTPASRPATWEDLWALPEGTRAEIVHGAVETLPSPTVEHQLLVGALNSELAGRHMHGRGGPGGWWLIMDVDVELAPSQVLRPDIAGWRRDRVPARPVRPVRELPDWVCEVMIPETGWRDRGVKMEIYRQHGVPFVWLADAAAGFVEAYRLEPPFYLRLGLWAADEDARIPPFDDEPIDLAGLLRALGYPAGQAPGER